MKKKLYFFALTIFVILILLIVRFVSYTDIKEGLEIPINKLGNNNETIVVSDSQQRKHYNYSPKSDTSETKCLYIDPVVLRNYMKSQGKKDEVSISKLEGETYRFFNNIAGSDQNIGIGKLTGAGGGGVWLDRRNSEALINIGREAPEVYIRKGHRYESKESGLHASSKSHVKHKWHDGTVTKAGDKPGTSGKSIAIITYKGNSGLCDLLPAGFTTATMEQVNEYVKSSIPFFKSVRVMVKDMPAHVNIRLNSNRRPTVLDSSQQKVWKPNYLKKILPDQCSLGLSPSWHTSVWVVADNDAIDGIRDNRVGWVLEKGTVFGM